MLNARKEQDITLYTAPADTAVLDVAGRRLKASPELQGWWCLNKNRRDETFIIRQENSNEKADVLELTLAQVYDLHHMLGVAILRS